MRFARLMAGSCLLAAATAAGGFWWQASGAGIEPAQLAENGIGPLRLDTDFQRAEQLAFRLAPDTAFSGPGCSGLDEIRYETRMGAYPVSVMAMADAGRIREIEAAVMEPNRADSLEDCLDLRDRFGEIFVQRFGDYQASWHLNKPVSQEHLAQTGPVLIKARWFLAGGSCNVSAHFGPFNNGSLRPEFSLAVPSG